MGDGLTFATLATLVGKRGAAKWGNRRVTIGAIGRYQGQRFVMGQFADGTVVTGPVEDFTVVKRKTKA